MAIAVPEARVLPLQETADGAVHPNAAAALDGVVSEADAILVGTGALDTNGAAALVRNLIPLIERAALVIDAGGLAAIADDPRLVAGLVRGAVLIPNSGEQNLIPGHDARSAADVTGAVVAVRGVETEVSGPGGPVFVDRSGNSGLASSGSGDVFAGALAGLCARGAEPLTATLWATAIHGRAGERCAERIGPVGYVARDLLAELPALVASCEK
jgi:NAD(P)H-hydrate repair Nnr-like enzyme with NAD(P)H-hydrate dehydratase domain